MSNCKVCIIGAGVSGLAAARNIADAGVSPSDVIVLEAQNRIGGRVKTVKSGDHNYDLGAAWFHDFLTNSVLHESIHDGTLLSSDGYFDDKFQKCYTEDGELDADALKLEQVRHDIDQFIELHYSQPDVTDLSLNEIVKVFFDKYGAFLEPAQKKHCGQMMRYLELWFGIASDKISAKYATLHHEGRNLYNRKGFSFLIDKLRPGLDIRINQQVTCIERDPIRIHTKNDVVSAEYLVVTVPQSVLALDEGHDYAITWKPQLPQPVRQAISEVHFGALGKVILEFGSVFWPENQDRFEIVASKYPSDPETPQPFEYPLVFINMLRVIGVKSLVCLTQSPLTDYLERNPGKAWDYMKPILAVIANIPGDLPRPEKMYITDWTINPYARGSYMAVQVNDDPTGCLYQLSGDYDTSAMGADSKIRFAGEHTIADGAGCVHGAYESGRRAARWILNDMGISTPA